MAIKRRSEQADVFLANVDTLDRDNLADLSADALIEKYMAIDKNVFHARLQQCKIVREIRLKFGNDDRSFGQYLSQTPLSDIPQHTRTRMIRVADFFEGKDITGITWSIALFLSEKRYASVAEIAYKEIVGKVVRATDVERRINALMSQRQLEKQDSNIIEGEFSEIPKERPPQRVLERAADKLIAEPPPTNKMPPAPIMKPIAVIKDEIGGVIEEYSEEDLKVLNDYRNVAVERVLKLIEEMSDVDQKYVLREALRRKESKGTGIPIKPPVANAYHWEGRH
jgi:hypothetical protein